MARRIPRIAVPGFYHVTSRGNNRRPIYLDDLDRETFLTMVGRVTERHWWACHSFCLMTNHFHLLLQTQDESLSAGMQRLNGDFAQTFNRRHGTIGHLFQDRFFSVPVTRQAHALWVIRYIAQNPVEAGIARTPEGWRWSSYGATLGLRRAPSFLVTSWVLGLFSDDLVTARRRLRTFAGKAS